MGFQHLNSSASLLQKSSDDRRKQIFCLNITRLQGLQEFFEAFFHFLKEIRSQSPHIHRHIALRIDRNQLSVRSRHAGAAARKLFDAASLHHIRQISILHLACLLYTSRCV